MTEQEKANIITAMETLHNMCTGFMNCYECPLGFTEGGCWLGEHSLSEWEYKDSTIWRAY